MSLRENSLVLTMGALVSNPDDTVTMKEQENIKAEKKKI
jgi:hypothetical protein